jgi:hypothetical protein
MKITIVLKAAVAPLIHTIIVKAIYAYLLSPQDGGGNIILVLAFVDFPFSLFIENETTDLDVLMQDYMTVGGLYWFAIGVLSLVAFRKHWHWAVLTMAVLACLGMACLFAILSKPM